jgi:outer membrane beta-barrel protein
MLFPLIVPNAPEVPMRRFSPLAVLVLVLGLSPTHPLQAQTPMQWDLTAFAGAAVFPGTAADEFLVCEGLVLVCDRIQDATMKAGVALGLHAGARFGAWSVEGSLAFVPTSLEGTSTLGQTVSVDTNVMMYGADLLYTLPGENPLMEVFLATGIGAKTHSPNEGDSQTNVMGNLGAGVRVWLSPSMAVRFEGRDYISSFDGESGSKLRNDLLFTVGLSFSPS